MWQWLLTGLFGKAGEKLGTFIPTKEEARRRDIDNLERKIDELKKQPDTPVNRRLHAKYANRLRELQKAAQRA